MTTVNKEGATMAIKTVGIIGAGIMGSGIAQIAAQRVGFDVLLCYVDLVIEVASESPDVKKSIFERLDSPLQALNNPRIYDQRGGLCFSGGYRGRTGDRYRHETGNEPSLRP